MHIVPRTALLLFVLLLFALSGRAQTQLGQPTLDEQKVQVWCATVKFVYEDTGRPNLRNQLQCGGSLKEFAASIKADSQRVYSALYEPLEVRGIMYRGLGSDKSRLQTLVKEIVNRLKNSPVRRGKPLRQQGVAALEAALTGYVQNGTPIATLPAAAESGADTTAVAEDPEPAPETLGDAGPAEAGVAAPAAPARGAGESMMNKFFGPLALILALLSLALYALLRRNIGAFQRELSARIDRRREEIMALQNAPVAAAAAPTAPAAVSSERLTVAQQREVEALVQQRLEHEISKLRRELLAAQPTASAAPAASQNPAPVATAPAPPATPPTSGPLAPISYALTSSPAPAFDPEPAPQTAAEAVSSDEFDSLVPPVQLPTPEPYVTPVTLSSVRYVKVPVNSAFNEYDLTSEPQHDSIYEITLDAQRPDAATFRVTRNPAMHAYAIQSAQYSLREACTYQQPSGPASRIVTEKDGVLGKVGSAWHIEQKAAIRFE